MITSIVTSSIPPHLYSYTSDMFFLTDQALNEQYVKIGCDISLDMISQPILIQVREQCHPHFGIETYFIGSQRSYDCIHLMSIIRLPTLDYIVLHKQSILELISVCTDTESLFFPKSVPTTVISFDDIIVGHLYEQYVDDTIWLSGSLDDREKLIEDWYKLKNDTHCLCSADHPFLLAYPLSSRSSISTEADKIRTIRAHKKILHKLSRLIDQYRPNQLYYLSVLGEPYGIFNPKQISILPYTPKHFGIYAPVFKDADMVQLLYYVFLLPFQEIGILFDPNYCKTQVTIPQQRYHQHDVWKIKLYITSIERSLQKLARKYPGYRYRLTIDKDKVCHIQLQDTHGCTIVYQDYMVPLFLLSRSEIVLL